MPWGGHICSYVFNRTGQKDKEVMEPKVAGTNWLYIYTFLSTMTTIARTRGGAMIENRKVLVRAVPMQTPLVES